MDDEVGPLNDEAMMIETDFDEPIIFRTTNAEVYEASLNEGSLWLRSDNYYRTIEDRARKDDSEGINLSRLTLPLRLRCGDGPQISVGGSGSIGQVILPHYILSLHGNSISAEQLSSFGSHTFGVRNISKLSAEILYRASQKLKCTGYRYGAVYYQNATLTLTQNPIGAPAMKLSNAPPVFLNSINTDILRKSPIMPFIEQDEWRIAIFVEEYLDGDPVAPLRINVEPSQFYACRGS